MEKELIEIEYFVTKSEYKGQKQLGAKIYHQILDQTFFIESEDSIERLNYFIKNKIEFINQLWKANEYDRLESILVDGLNIPKDVNWNLFKKYKKFEELNPDFTQIDEIKRKYPCKRHIIRPQILSLNMEEFKRVIKEPGKIIEYKNAIKEVENDTKKVEEEFKIELDEYLKKSNTLYQKIDKEINEREKRKKDYYKSQETDFKYIDDLKEQYLNNNINTVIEYSKLILNLSNYPFFIQKQFEIDYNLKTRILVVDYALPPIDALPTMRNFKKISETQAQKNFEKTMYSITLRTIYELFHTDIIDAIDSICFNGWVNGINKATGKRENKCILSIQTCKQEFQEIDLHYVDPKACFKSFKGISANKLISITPIQPIIHINRNDKRFVDSHSVTENIDDSTNLAAMDWEDFEHLIREIFEKEFSSNGGEVKVTQASRDGGVDAIAFDPDPIRGGKIVIQAKRYTNTVGVSAVRDLFGTVMNEGATKGILVTTSDYGSDSYEFAKGKPLTLLNGSNLLYLLEKHGHKAKIDIEEARKLMKGIEL